MFPFPDVLYSGPHCIKEIFKHFCRTLSEMEHQMAESENEIRARDENISNLKENISNLKLIISRITSNNNDMLAILVKKWQSW